MKYRINSDYFKSWSPSMAYVLGFIYGDGCITKGGRKSYSLKISSIDHDILISIKNELEAERPIYKHKNKNLYQLSIGSKIIYQDLLNLGIEERKQFRDDAPVVNIVPNEYFSHFIRGFIDSDGCISVSKRSGTLRISITGKEKVLKSVGNRLINLGIVDKFRIRILSPCKYTVRNDNASIEFDIINCFKLGDCIYNDANIFLLRKKDIYDNARKYVKCKKWTDNEKD